MAAVDKVADPGDAFRFARSLQLMEHSGVIVGAATRWLDLGCNQGQFLRYLSERFALKAIGADIWDPALKSAQDSNWEYHQCDFAQGLPDCEPVDVLSAMEVLEHIIDTDQFLSRAFDLVRPGGSILISTPNINCLRNRLLVPLGAYPYGLEYKNLIHHVRLYNVPALRDHLAEYGFRDISIWGVAFLPLSSRLGGGALSRSLAERFPELCNNIIAVARRG